jgi:hypothetical protein
MPTMSDMPLHQLHDNPESAADSQRTFTPPPNGYKDIDVVFKNSLYEPAAIFHVVYNIGREVPVGRHEVILRGFGATVEPRF